MIKKMEQKQTSSTRLFYQILIENIFIKIHINCNFALPYKINGIYYGR